MNLLVIGVNHKKTPIALREQLAFSHDELPIVFSQLKSFINGSVILSTCNRTEIYLLAPNFQVKSTDVSQRFNHRIILKPEIETTEQNMICNGCPRLEKIKLAEDYSRNIQKTISAMKQWLADYKSIDLEQLEPYLYLHHNHKALTHWIRVASGLDSMILGEPQILGQIKQAVNQAKSCNSLSKNLEWIINQVFSSAKQVRHDTQIGSQAVTLGFATAKLATQIFDDLSKCHLLIIATGEMNRLVSSHIAGQNIGRITLCNRSIEKANVLAEELAKINSDCIIDVQPLDNLNEYLIQADIVSSCSGSMQKLISFDTCKKLIKQRRYRPILMVDLAVPRDIEERVNRLDEIYLYSIDDLQHVIAGNIDQRRQAALEAEILVSQLVVEIEGRFQIRQVGNEIQLYRDKANKHADRLLNDSLLQLQQGEASAEEVISELARKLTQTLTHSPSKLMQAIAVEGDSKTLGIVTETLTNAYRKN